MEILGFNITRKPENIENLEIATENLETESGIIEIDADLKDVLGYGQGFNYTTHFNQEFENEKQLIDKYKEMSMNPHVADAIQDIINEAVVLEGQDDIIELDLDDVNLPDSTKKKVIDQFKHIIKILDFNKKAQEYFEDWYINGKQYAYLAIDKNKTKQGIQKIVFLPPARTRKVKIIEYNEGGYDSPTTIKSVEEKYIYTQKSPETETNRHMYSFIKQVKNEFIAEFSADAVVYTHSHIFDEENNLVLSNLHKAIKAYNQLEQVEDAILIYRLVRAPEKRIFYIDIGNMNKGKAEEYMNSFIAKFRNNVSYDQKTGNITSQKKNVMSVFNDWFFPRKEGNRSTEVTTLDSSLDLGNLEDVERFHKKLLKALNLPQTRLDPEATFSLGRAAEITRDEIKFHKFVNKLRLQYSDFFIDTLRVQLISTGIMKEDDFEKIKNDIKLAWKKDNYFEELKDSEIFSERLELLERANEFVGEYFSKDLIFKQVLRMTDDEIEEEKKLMEEEEDDGDYDNLEHIQTGDERTEFNPDIPEPKESTTIPQEQEEEEKPEPEEQEDDKDDKEKQPPKKEVEK